MKIVGILLFFIILAYVPVLHAGERGLTVIHTNDMHSHFLGFSPNLDYTGDTTGDDSTSGGWARIATVIREVRENSHGPVLVLDAGDFMMGSLFHMLSREHAFELSLLKAMGYDAVTIGNHEFDLKPEGLAEILNTAEKNSALPEMLLANAVFSEESSADDRLEALFRRGVVKPYKVFEREGVRVGVFGIMGIDAAEKAPFASPVSFSDPVACAREMVEILRNREGVDVIICLSHSGLSKDPKKSEDEILAREVPGIDAVIGGHSHTRRDNASLVDGVPVVQAWSYGREVGILELSLAGGPPVFKSWKKVHIDDTLPGDPEIIRMISGFEKKLENGFLSDMGLSMRRVVARTGFDLVVRDGESNLGNFLADSVRWSVNRYVEDPVAVAIVSNGVIRDPVLKGQTGNVAACDLFRTIPLGIGMDGSMGYPLVSFYIYPHELKKGLEILTSIAPLKGSDYFLHVSGLRMSYNPKRVPFDRVTGVWLGEEESGYEPLDCSRKNKRLIRVAADIYNATFLKIIGGFTWNILNISPRDKHGNPSPDLAAVRVDTDLTTEGTQELKEWRAPFDFLKSLSGEHRDGIPEIPEKYRGKTGRIVSEPSINPYSLLKGGNWLTWLVFSLCALAVALVSLGFYGILLKVRG